MHTQSKKNGQGCSTPLSNSQLINLVIPVNFSSLKQRKSIKIFSFHQILYNTYAVLLYKLLKKNEIVFAMAIIEVKNSFACKTSTRLLQ